MRNHPRKFVTDAEVDSQIQENLAQNIGGIIVDTTNDLVAIMAPDMKEPLALSPDEAVGLMHALIDGIKNLDKAKGRVRCPDCLKIHPMATDVVKKQPLVH